MYSNCLRGGLFHNPNNSRVYCTSGGTNVRSKQKMGKMVALCFLSDSMLMLFP